LKIIAQYELSMAENKATKCLVVGAGPVGALAALYAARRGWEVEVYELRGGQNIRKTESLKMVD